MTLLDITRTYNGSSGQATRLMYARLNEFGPSGIVALNLLRACKASARACPKDETVANAASK